MTNAIIEYDLPQPFARANNSAENTLKAD